MRCSNSFGTDLDLEVGTNHAVPLEKDPMRQPDIPPNEMIDQILILAWCCRPDGTTEFLNQRWLEYTGLSMEEALDWGWKAAIHPDDFFLDAELEQFLSESIEECDARICSIAERAKEVL